MSSKVVSTKLKDEEYDKLLQHCNEKGCTVSQFLKDTCIQSIANPNINTEQLESQEQQIYELKEKITKFQNDLDSANSTISEQTKKIKAYSEFVDPIAFHIWKSKNYL